VDIAARTDRTGRGRIRVARVAIFSDGHDEAAGLVIFGLDATVQVDVTKAVPGLWCRVTIHDHLDRPVCSFQSRMQGNADTVAKGTRFSCSIPEFPLLPGSYHMGVALYVGGDREDVLDAVGFFQVEHGTLGGRHLPPGQLVGAFSPPHTWTVPEAP
jgi:hypothetical protein